MNIVAFAASSSRNSINAKLVRYACSLTGEADIEVLDINDYAMPIYSIDVEQDTGIPQAAHDFLAKISHADALVISFAEHNGLYTAAYKSLFDWVSRIDTSVYQDKPVVMLATSPGGRGARNVLNIAATGAAHFGGKVVATLSIPKFYDNFDSEENCLTHPELDAELKQAIALLARPDFGLSDS